MYRRLPYSQITNAPNKFRIYYRYPSFQALHQHIDKSYSNSGLWLSTATGSDCSKGFKEKKELKSNYIFNSPQSGLDMKTNPYSFRPIVLKGGNISSGYIHTRSFSTSNNNNQSLDGKSDNNTQESDSKELSAEEEAANKSYLQKFKDFCYHYYIGSKLLATNISVASKLVRKVTKGYVLTRRERKLLLQTSADILRIFPFLFFMIVPFMEFLLPFALRLFPNMLPSTFTEKHTKEEYVKKQLKMRIEMADFMQQAYDRYVSRIENSGDAEKIQGLLAQVKSDGELNNESIILLAKNFSDEFTLKNIRRQELVYMCRYMGISTVGTDFYLKYQINKKIHTITQDDVMIQKEGIDALTLSELRSAVRERGMRTIGATEEQLKKSLTEWLELSLKHDIPPALLIYSRAFNITRYTTSSSSPSKDTTSDRKEGDVLGLIKDTMKELAQEDDARDNLILESTGIGGNEAMLKYIRDQRDSIKMEEEEIEIKKDTEENLISDADADQVLTEVIQAVALCASESPVEDERHKLQELRDQLLDTPKRQDLVEAMEVISKNEHVDLPHFDSITVADRRKAIFDAIRKLKRDDDESSEELEDGEIQQTIDDKIQDSTSIKEEEKTIVEEKEEDGVKLKLKQKIESMLDKINDEIDKAESSIGDSFRLIDTDSDGVINYSELRNLLLKDLKVVKTDEEVKEVFSRLDTKGDGVVDLEELIKVLEEMDVDSDDESSVEIEQKKDN